MRRKEWTTKWLPAALALGMLVGCGTAPTATTVRPASQLKAQTAATPVPAPGASSSDPMGGDINNNPIVLWIKQAHPQTGAQLIDDYISTKVLSNSNSTVEAQRSLLRQQALDTVTKEFNKNLAKGLPTGLRSVVSGTTVHCSGVTQQYGMDVTVAFDFTINIDAQGIIWIREPSSSCMGSSSSLLIKMFGGNLADKVHQAVTDALDAQGPKSAITVIGLSYYKGGTFRLDPGAAFIAMPSLPT